jgi:DNA replication protein DnaC
MTIHDPSLKLALKTLKLTGRLDTLDARLAQTRDGKLGHLEFLQVRCEDEIARRETAALARRVRRARFEQPSTFEDFDFTVSPRHAHCGHGTSRGAIAPQRRLYDGRRQSFHCRAGVYQFEQGSLPCSCRSPSTRAITTR